MISKKDIPNILTYGRLVAIPLLIVVFMMGNHLASFLVFGLASLTDFFDGYLARKWKLETKFGAMIDQIADKLLVCAALLCLVSTNSADLIPVVIIIFREIFVSGLREFMGNEGIAMPVSGLGKWKTATQLIAIVLLMIAPLYSGQTYGVEFFGTILLWLSAALSAITAIQYWRVVSRNI